jgi:hypothetical protein
MNETTTKQLVEAFAAYEARQLTVAVRQGDIDPEELEWMTDDERVDADEIPPDVLLDSLAQHPDEFLPGTVRQPDLNPTAIRDAMVAHLTTLQAELATSNFGSEGIHDDEFPDEHSHDPKFELNDMGVEAGVFATDDEGRHYWLEVKTTSEGLIIDVWDRYGEEPLATFARTFDELVDFVFANNPVNEQPCQHYAAKSAPHERPRWLVIEKTLVSADTRDEAIDAAVNCLKGYDQEVELQDAVLVIESDETDGRRSVYSVGKVQDHKAKTYAWFTVLRDAESFIAETLNSHDPEGVAAGRYYIDGPYTIEVPS